MTGFNSKRKIREEVAFDLSSDQMLKRTTYEDGTCIVQTAVQSAARTIADEQSFDTGLWFVATTVTEAHLQAALRRLAAAVEGEAPVARTPLTNEQIWALATQCTVGSDLHIDKFARAIIEAAHGIKPVALTPLTDARLLELLQEVDALAVRVPPAWKEWARKIEAAAHGIGATP